MKPMAEYNRPPWRRTKLTLKVFGEGLLLLFVCSLLYVGFWLVAALSEPYPSETRCFSRAYDDGYCRDQSDWGDN